MVNSNDKIFLSVESTLEILLNNLFEDLSFDKSKALSNPEMEKLVSTFSYICKDNSLIKISYTKEDIEIISIHNNYDIKNICRLFSESIYGRKGEYRNNLQEDISRSFKNYYEWKQKYLSREKALEKYNTTESTAVAKEEKNDNKINSAVKSLESILPSIKDDKIKNNLENLLDRVRENNEEEVEIVEPKSLEDILPSIKDDKIKNNLESEISSSIKDEYIKSKLEDFYKEVKDSSSLKEIIEICNNESNNNIEDLIKSVKNLKIADLIEKFEEYLSAIEFYLRDKIVNIAKVDVDNDGSIIELSKTLLDKIKEEVNTKNYLLKYIISFTNKTLNEIINKYSNVEDLKLPTLEEIRGDFKGSLDRFCKIINNEVEEEISWNQAKYLFDDFNSKLIYNDIVDGDEDENSIYCTILNKVNQSGLPEDKVFDDKKSKTKKMLAFRKNVSKKEEEKPQEKIEKEVKAPSNSSEVIEDDTVEEALKEINKDFSTSEPNKGEIIEEVVPEIVEDESKIVLQYPATIMNNNEVEKYIEFLDVDISLLNKDKAAAIEFIDKKADKYEALAKVFDGIEDSPNALVGKIIQINKALSMLGYNFTEDINLTDDAKVLNKVAGEIRKATKRKRITGEQAKKLARMQLGAFENILVGRPATIVE